MPLRAFQLLAHLAHGLISAIVLRLALSRGPAFEPPSGGLSFWRMTRRARVSYLVGWEAKLRGALTGSTTGFVGM
jgi:hypothetical protein